MAQFMPVNEEAARSLQERLARTMFKSPQDFLNFYNSGLINKRHEDVKAFADDLTTTFKNVKEKGGALVFITQEEVYLEEILQDLQEWAGLVRLKREVASLLQEEEVAEKDAVYLNASQAGLFRDDLNEEGKRVTLKLSNERFFTTLGELASAYEKHSTLKNEEAEAKGNYFFAAADFLHLEDDFINSIKGLMP